MSIRGMVGVPVAARFALRVPEETPTFAEGSFLDGSTGFVTKSFAGNWVSSPDSSALDVTGDLEIVARMTLPDWTPSTTPIAPGGKAADNSSTDAYLFYFASGRPILQWYDSSNVARSLTASADVPFSDGQMGWIKVTLDVDNGSGQCDVKFYTAADQATEPTSWTQLGTTRTGNFGTTSIRSTTQTLNLMGRSNTAADGTLARYIIRNGIDGTVAFDADFAAQPAHALAFTESSSNAAVVQINSTRYTYGIPGAGFTTVGTYALSANTDAGIPFFARDGVTVDMLAFEVTTGPTSTSTVHAAVYATQGGQPTGSPVISWGPISVPTGGSVVYARNDPKTLPPGNYILLLNPSVAFTARSWRMPGVLASVVGANPLLANVTVARTNGAFPSTPVGWTTRAASNVGFQAFAALRYGRTP